MQVARLGGFWKLRKVLKGGKLRRNHEPFQEEIRSGTWIKLDHSSAKLTEWPTGGNQMNQTTSCL
jgi:hypothetical protein